jgi:RNase P/RNase MRP subunit p30
MVLIDASVTTSSTVMDKELANLGFEVVFINMTINTKNQQIARISNSLREIRESSGLIPVSTRTRSRSLTRDILKILTSSSQPFSLHKLTRVTVALQVNDQVDKINESILRPIRDDPLIDCFAIRPATESQLIDLITNRDKYGYDLISLDVSVGYFFQQLGTVSRLIKNADDLLIEIELTPILSNNSGITNSVNQCRMVLKSAKGMIVSSGAKSPMELKSGVDMCGWGEGVMGLKCIQKNSERLLEKIVRKKLVRSNFN